MSTAYTALLAGAMPVFADVSRDTITLDPEQIRRRITPRTRAIIPVHWFGHPADMDGIMELARGRGLDVIEDCAHGPAIWLRGQHVGRFGRIACWSMQQTKLITSAGEGGMATTDNDALAARLRQMRDHGKAQPGQPGSPIDDDPCAFVSAYRITALGTNYRLSELHAAFARAQLSKMGEFRDRRRQAYERMREGLRGIAGIELTQQKPGVEVSYVYFPVLFPSESFNANIMQIVQAYRAEGVIVHPIALDEMCHTQPIFADPALLEAAGVAYGLRGHDDVPAYGAGTQPVAEKIAGELLVLPMHPDLSEQDVDDIVAATKKIAEAYRR